MFVLASIKAKWLKVVPPPVFVAIFGLIMGQVLGLNSQYMIHLPDHPFVHGMVPGHRGASGSDRFRIFRGIAGHRRGASGSDRFRIFC